MSGFSLHHNLRALQPLIQVAPAHEAIVNHVMNPARAPRRRGSFFACWWRVTGCAMLARSREVSPMKRLVIVLIVLIVTGAGAGAPTRAETSEGAGPPPRRPRRPSCSGARAMRCI